MDPTDPFQAPAGATTFGSRNAAFGAGRSGALHSVTGVASNTKRASFATGGTNRMSGLAPTSVNAGLTGVATSQRTQMWGTGRGKGTVNGIGGVDQTRLATMPQL